MTSERIRKALISAVQKQIAKPVYGFIVWDEIIGECLSCHHTFKGTAAYCPYCGQKLKWETTQLKELKKRAVENHVYPQKSETKTESENVARVTAKESGLNILGATLLTTEEALRLPDRLREYNTLWWLRSPIDAYYDRAAYVNYIGFIDDFLGRDVGYDGFSVRPILTISNLESSDLKIGDTFEFGNKEFEIISDDKAFCLDDIGRMAFKKTDSKVLNANNYERSDVKKYIDEWFKKSIEESKEVIVF